MPNAYVENAFSRRKILCGCCAALVGLKAIPLRAEAMEDSPNEPVLMAFEEPHHHYLTHNDYFRVLRVLIPPGAWTLWHDHKFDFVVTGVIGTPMELQEKGQAQAHAGELVTGSIAYSPFAEEPMIHRVSNSSRDTLNHQLATEILLPKPGGFKVSDRNDDKHCTLEIDNARVRVWRTKLGPGEIAKPLTLQAPSLRFILSGERVIETSGLGKVEETIVRKGDYAFPEPLAQRSLTNASAEFLEFLDIELK